MASGKPFNVLLVPVFNFPRNLNADSIYNISGDWARGLCESDPNMTVHRLLPMRDLEDRMMEYSYSYKKVHDRVIDHFVPMYTKYYFEEAHVDFNSLRRFHPQIGSIPIHAVVCTSSLKTMYIKRLFTSGGGSVYGQGFFNFELLIRGIGSNEVGSVTEEEMTLQALGATHAYNLYQSPKCKSISTAVARKYMSRKLTSGIFENSDMVYSGYSAKEAFVPDEKNEVFTVIVRGRITASKNVDKILDLYNKFQASGREIKILLTSGTSSRSKEIVALLESNRNIEFVQCETKQEANELMRKAHAFVFWSTHELFAVSFWEMLASGLIGIVFRADWFKGLLPDGYPYIFSKRDEAYGMLADVYENYDERRKELAWVVDEVERKFAYRNTTKNAARLIRDKSPDQSPRDWITGLIGKHCDAGVSLSDAIDCIGKHSDQGEASFWHKSPHRLDKCVGVLEVFDAMTEADHG